MSVRERCRRRVTVKGGKGKRAGGGLEARLVTSLGPPSLRARRTLRLEGQPTGSFSVSGEFQGALLERACHLSPLVNPVSFRGLGCLLSPRSRISIGLAFRKLKRVFCRACAFATQCLARVS